MRLPCLNLTSFMETRLPGAPSSRHRSTQGEPSWPRHRLVPGNENDLRVGAFAVPRRCLHDGPSWSADRFVTGTAHQLASPITQASPGNSRARLGGALGPRVELLRLDAPGLEVRDESRAA